MPKYGALGAGAPSSRYHLPMNQRGPTLSYGRFLVRLSVLFCAVPLLSAGAQGGSTGAWTIEDVRANCVPIEESDPEVERYCTVAEFDEVVSIGTHTLYYALYQDSLPDSERSHSDNHSNVLVLFSGSTADDSLDLLHVRHYMRSWWVSYDAPKILESERGPILYLPGAGIGDGRSQYAYDEYWLWKDDSWQELDVWGWYAETNHMSEFLPPDHSLDGIGYFDLTSMRYTGDVRRSEDCHNCATGGRMTISFEWRDLELKVKDVEYFPIKD